MLSSELKAILESIGISQAEFARLIGVTPRGVSLWMVGDRAIPGPVEAYAHLLQTIPLSQRQLELSRLTQRKTEMRDGMYGIGYRSAGGEGNGIFVLENGRVYGADYWGGKYDGEYIYNEASKKADLKVKITMAPNSRSVLGIQQPYEWSIDATTSFDPTLENGRLMITTALGPKIAAEYKFLRSLPEA